MSDHIKLTKRQAEALWAARETGFAQNIVHSVNDGPFWRMINGLVDQGLVGGLRSEIGFGAITPDGRAELALWEQTHPKTTLNPRVYRSKS